MDGQLRKLVPALYPADYGLDPRYGCLPRNALREFPSGYKECAILDELMEKLPEMLRQRTLQATVKKIPLLCDLELPSYEFNVRQRLGLVFEMLSAAYLDPGNNPAGGRLPAKLAVPLAAVSSFEDKPPSLSYPRYALWNQVTENPLVPLAPDNFKVLHTFSGTSDETGFIDVHLGVEAAAAPFLWRIGEAQLAVLQDDPVMLYEFLEQARAAWYLMNYNLTLMWQRCSDEAFHKTFRSYLFFFRNVVYEGVKKYGGKPMTFPGESGAESIVLAAADALTGVKHPDPEGHLMLFEGCMLKPHRRFLQAIRKGFKIRDYISRKNLGGLKIEFNNWWQEVVKYSKIHSDLANIYIAQKTSNPRGTGGTTPFMDWLHQHIETRLSYLV